MNFIKITDKNYLDYKDKICNFFNSNIEDYKFFHPHGFSIEDFYKEIENKNKDTYIFMEDNKQLIGYGLLRGLDRGFEIPSLGILISKEWRGKGYSVLLMNHLHEISKQLNMNKVRLTVYKENKIAISLYNKLGYKFSEKNNEELLGIKEI